MQEWIIHFASSHEYLIYAVIIITACAEGPILSMIFGVLIRLGYFGFWPVYTALMIGDLLGDSIWYYVGRKYGHRFIARFGKYVDVTEGRVEKVEQFFHKHKHPVLFFSKISNGFGLSAAVLFTAGIVQIPFARYIFTNLLGQFIWSGFLIGVGYYFSHAYMLVNSWLEKAGIVAAFVVLVLLFIGFSKYLKKRAEKAL